MPDLRSYQRGDAITAERLNPLVQSARRVLGAPGAPSATISVPVGPVVEIPVVVVARDLEEPGVLTAHGYTVRGGGEDWPVDYTRLVVPVEAMLIQPVGPPDPNNLPMGFAPAAVAGSAEAQLYPWRSWGKLIRFAGADGARDHAVELYGLVPARGC